MGKTRKYSYKEWWDGKILLVYASYEWSKGDKPIAVTWDNILVGDIATIQKKQKEIFEEQVATKFELFKETFLSGYNKSKLKESYLTDEIEQSREILLGLPESSTVQFTKVYGTGFPVEDLQEIRFYIRTVIKRGIEADFSFIHSPNCKFQNTSKLPNHVYAAALWNYYEWLQEFKGIDTKPAITNNEFNPYPAIFKNYHSYLLFIELKKATVIPPTKIADYSFIYYKLKDASLKAIHPNISQPAFINFLNTNMGEDIGDKSFPFRDPRSKQAIYKSILDRFKHKILEE